MKDRFEEFLPFFIGAIVATIITVNGFTFLFEAKTHMQIPTAIELVKACEKDIPRNQECRLVAIPVKGNQNE